MLYPGSKGWITKYGSMLQQNEVRVPSTLSQQNDVDEFLHINFTESGLIFGHHISFLFYKGRDSKKWEEENKLALLLFEGLYTVYLVKAKSETSYENFVDSLFDFYVKSRIIDSKNAKNTFDSKITYLEKALKKRTEKKGSLIESSILLNYLNNSFIYLDIILFSDFLSPNNSVFVNSYSKYAYQALQILAFAAFSDGEISLLEQSIFDKFSEASKLDDSYSKINVVEFGKNFSIDNFDFDHNDNKLYKYFVLSIAVLIIYSSELEIMNNERTFLEKLSKRLDLNEVEFEENLAVIENFILTNSDHISFWKNKRSHQLFYDNLSNKWIKLLGRNKDKLVKELKQNKELISLIKKSMTTDLTSVEKEKVKTQFMELLKSMPSLAIFMLPGGALLLPIVLKVIPSLLPSSFKDNE